MSVLSNLLFKAIDTANKKYTIGFNLNFAGAPGPSIIIPGIGSIFGAQQQFDLTQISTPVDIPPLANLQASFRFNSSNAVDPGPLFIYFPDTEETITLYPGIGTNVGGGLETPLVIACLPIICVGTSKMIFTKQADSDGTMRGTGNFLLSTFDRPAYLGGM